ncbi:MAG: DUF4149 domain-containing protein [Candidatus Polarisedimenticolia bacterium]
MSLGWVAGAILGGAVAAVLLFQAAPSREVAGQVGQVVFNWLGRVVLVLMLVGLISRFLLDRPGAGGEAPRRTGSLDLWLTAAACAAAAVLALWITPAMDEIWTTAPHDPAGSGLMGADKSRFMRLHGVGNLLYLTLLTVTTLLVARRSFAGR